MAASPKSSRKIAEFDKQISKWDAICLKNGWKKINFYMANQKYKYYIKVGCNKQGFKNWVK